MKLLQWLKKMLNKFSRGTWTLWEGKRNEHFAFCFLHDKRRFETYMQMYYEKMNYKKRNEDRNRFQRFWMFVLYYKEQNIKKIVYIYMDEKAFCVLTKFVMDHGKWYTKEKAIMKVSCMRGRTRERRKFISFFTWIIRSVNMYISQISFPIFAFKICTVNYSCILYYELQFFLNLYRTGVREWVLVIFM